MSWSELPDTIREFAGDLLGSVVVEAVSQSAGYSPGTADRIRGANGRRAFLKAVSRDRSEPAYSFHRRESGILGMLPATLPVPRLLGAYDDGGWAAVVTEDVPGGHPETTMGQLVVTLDALSTMPLVRRRSGWESLPELSEELLSCSSGWSALRADQQLASLPPGARDHLGVLQRLADRAPGAVKGDRLVHADLRADNVLLDGDGRAWIVDWPHARVGAGWFDGLTLLLDTRLRGTAVDLDGLIAQHPLFADAGSEEIDAVLSSLAAYFLDSARRPAPAGMPTLRRFQFAQGEECLSWLAARRGW